MIVAYISHSIAYSFDVPSCRFFFVYNNRLVQQHQEVEKRLQELEKQKQQPQPQPGQRNLPPTPDQQRLIAEINALKQRLQETGARSENEVEQWRKVVEQEKVGVAKEKFFCFQAILAILLRLFLAKWISQRLFF